MSRLAITALLVAALITGAPGVGGAAGPTPLAPFMPTGPATPDRHMAITGILVYAPIDGPTYFQVNGYVLLGVTAERLKPLLGRTVLVKGTMVTEPTIFMRRALAVEEITAYAPHERPIQVTLAGTPIPMEQPPIVVNNRTLVGLRAVAEAVGARVAWEECTRKVTVERGNRRVTLQIGRPEVTVQIGRQEPQRFETDVAPILQGGRTMVPIRVLAEGLGLNVVWDPTMWTVQLS